MLLKAAGGHKMVEIIVDPERFRLRIAALNNRLVPLINLQHSQANLVAIVQDRELPIDIDNCHALMLALPTNYYCHCYRPSLKSV
jgi:hypothetical protein